MPNGATIDIRQDGSTHQSIADQWGYGYVIGPQNEKYPYSYGWGQKTKELCIAHYFCGGEADGNVFWTNELHMAARTSWFLITDYKWTPFILGRESDWPARVWQSIHTHVCTYQDWIPMPPQQLSVIQQVWAELDAAYHKFNNDNTITNDATTHLKGYMRGLCTSVRILMNPRFVSDDDVVAEVHKRHIMRQAETPYVTPGVGEPMNPERLMQKPRTNGYAETRVTEVATVHNLAPETVEKIKAARAAGFPDDDLCTMYGIKQNVLASL